MSPYYNDVTNVGLTLIKSRALDKRIHKQNSRNVSKRMSDGRRKLLAVKDVKTRSTFFNGLIYCLA